MRALGKLKSEPGLWEYEALKPEIKHNEVLIKIKKTGICGTDVHIYNWDNWAQETIPSPITTGHEFVGEIVEVGVHVEFLKIGDRVSGEGHTSCGHCRNCRAGRRHLCHFSNSIGVTQNGAFAEYLALPAKNVFKIPNDIDDNVAAILDPLGNATHAALSFEIVGEDVLITGAGPIGIMTAAIARYIGARHVVITDVNQHRLDIVKKFKGIYPVHTKETTLKDVMEELNIHEGFEVGLEMSGSAIAFNNMLDVMNHGGSIAMLGFLPRETQIDFSQFIMKGLLLKGIYGREMFKTWYKMIYLLQGGLDISPIITHQFASQDYEKAFEIMRSGQSGKVILDWER